MDHPNLNILPTIKWHSKVMQCPQCASPMLCRGVKEFPYYTEYHYLHKRPPFNCPVSKVTYSVSKQKEVSHETNS